MYFHVRDHQLPRAIERDDVDTLRNLLARYPNLPRWEDKEMGLLSPMAMAAYMGALGALEVLLEHHARDLVPRTLEDDIPRPFFTPLNAACQAAQISVVRYLLNLDPPWNIEELDDYGNTPLLSALQADSAQAEQSEDIIRLLLDRGADATVVVKSPDPWSIAAIEPPPDTPPPNRVIATALTKAMPSASPRVINWLADAGAQLHGRIDLETPLHIGCAHHNVHGVRTLLQLGAAPDLTTPDSAGRLPLHRAVDWRKVWRNMKWGLFKFPEEPVDVAIFQEIVALLLSDDRIRLATLNAKDSSGNTPLRLAAGFYYLPVLQQLLDYGADPSIRDGQGCSLLHILLTSDHPKYDVIPSEIESGLDEALIRRLLSPFANQRDGDSDCNRDTKRNNDSDCNLKRLINEPDARGDTPLHLAANAWLEHTMAVLLSLGARPSTRNCAGDTPAHLAADMRGVATGHDRRRRWRSRTACSRSWLQQARPWTARN